MSLLNAYLTFDGNAAEAMRFYEKTLGGKMEMLMTVGESPEAANMPPEAASRLMHASLVVGDSMLTVSYTHLTLPTSDLV